MDRPMMESCIWKTTKRCAATSWLVGWVLCRCSVVYSFYDRKQTDRGLERRIGVNADLTAKDKAREVNRFIQSLNDSRISSSSVSLQSATSGDSKCSYNLQEESTTFICHYMKNTWKLTDVVEPRSRGHSKGRISDVVGWIDLIALHPMGLTYYHNYFVSVSHVDRLECFISHQMVKSHNPCIWVSTGQRADKQLLLKSHQFSCLTRPTDYIRSGEPAAPREHLNWPASEFITWVRT